MAFNLFPFTNLHNLNTDWILKTIKDLKTAAETAASQVQEALANAVLYISQSKDTSSRRVACTNIHAVSYDSTPLQSTEAAQARANIGAAAASAVPDVSDVLRYSAQSLTDDQKLQARTNQGTASQEALISVSGRVSSLEGSRVSYTAQQQLTVEQQATARENIGAISRTDMDVCVQVYEQTFNSTEQAQARSNIGAADASAIPDVSDMLRYSVQSLTTGQKSQARENIGAANAIVVEELENVVTYNIVISETATDVFSIIGGNLENARDFADEGVVIITLNTLLNGVIRGVANFSDFTNSGTISAVLTEPAAPGPGISIGYRILISNNGTNDVLSITSFEYKLMPSCTSSDRGKILTVASTGQPVWEDKGPLMVTFSGSDDTSDASCNVTYNSLLSAINSGKLVIINYQGTGTYAGVSINNLEFTIDSAGFALSRRDTFGVELTIVYSAQTLSIEYYP